MKYIKKFESVGVPQIGDYVACDEKLFDNNNKEDINIYNFISNTIGCITDIEKGGSYYDSFGNKVNIIYIVKYDKYPKGLSSYFDNLFFSEYEVKFWSKNKEDVEVYLSGKKYNL